MGVDVSFEGLGDLIDRLEGVVANASKIENEALQEAMAPIIEEAKQTAAFHDRSGKLRRSLKVSGVKVKGGQKFILGGVMDSKAFYGRMVEFGTSRAAAHPFLAPAFEHHQAEAEEIIRKRIAEALKE